MGTPVKIPEAASIALHACLWLSRHRGRYRTTREIVGEVDCSHAHLAKVIQSLARAGIIETRRGPAGGVRLAADPAATTLMTVYEAVEGRIPPGHGCLLPRSVCPGRNCVLGRALANLREQFVTMLQHTTLADISESPVEEMS